MMTTLYVGRGMHVVALPAQLPGRQDNENCRHGHHCYCSVCRPPARVTSTARASRRWTYSRVVSTTGRYQHGVRRWTVLKTCRPMMPRRRGCHQDCRSTPPNVSSTSTSSSPTTSNIALANTRTNNPPVPWQFVNGDDISSVFTEKHAFRCLPRRAVFNEQRKNKHH